MSPSTHPHPPAPAPPPAGPTPTLTPTQKRKLVLILKTAVKIFLLSLVGLSTVDELRRVLGRRGRSRSGAGVRGRWKSWLKTLPTHLKTSLFFTLYPTLFRLLNVLRPVRSGSGTSSVTTSITSILNQAILLSPLIHLLPSSWATQINLYGSTAGMVMLAKWGSREILAMPLDRGDQREGEKGKKGKGRAYEPYWLNPPDLTSSTSPTTSSTSHPTSPPPPTLLPRPLLRFLKRLPAPLSAGGAWYLFPLSQGWLLHTALFHPRAFPRSYRRVIVRRSGRYVPTAGSLGMGKGKGKGKGGGLFPPGTDFLNSLTLFSSLPSPHPSFPSLSSLSSFPFTLSTLPPILAQYTPFLPILTHAHPHHSKLICATLHPLEPSCTVNYLRAVMETFPSALGLVGGWSGLVLLSRWRGVLRNPPKALHTWLKTTLQGSSLISLSISTAWLWVCIFQRLLPPLVLPRGRFALGGALAGLWIFLVPHGRRVELGVYGMRLGLEALWKVGVGKGWWTVTRNGRVIPFALSMALMTFIARQPDRGDRGKIMDGWVGRVVRYLDQDRDRDRDRDRGVVKVG